MPSRIQFGAAALLLGGTALVLGAGSAPAPAAAPVLAPKALPAPLPEVPRDGQLGFIVAMFLPAIVPGVQENCPAGTVKNTRDVFLEMIPAAERVRLLKPENEVELTRRWKGSSNGPNNTNICSNFDLFPDRPIQNLVRGKTAYGLDLDHGGKDGDSCTHDEFVNPAGDRGIDNQAYRAFGCTNSWRGPDGGPGEIYENYKNYLARGEYKIVILLRGVDSLRKDDDVEVIMASSDDVPIVDAQQKFVPGATFNVSANPRWRNVLKGRIADGVLETNPGSIVLSQPIANGGPRARRSEYDFTRARLRITLNADGSFKGVLGGYQPIYNMIARTVRAGVGAATIASQDCASQYNTLVKLADGDRNPVTGKCSRISSAWEISGVASYVIDQSRQQTVSR